MIYHIIDKDIGYIDNFDILINLINLVILILLNIYLRILYDQK